MFILARSFGSGMILLGFGEVEQKCTAVQNLPPDGGQVREGQEEARERNTCIDLLLARPHLPEMPINL